VLDKVTSGCSTVVFDSINPPTTSPRGVSVVISARAWWCQSLDYEFGVLYPGAAAYRLVQPHGGGSMLNWPTASLRQGTHRFNVCPNGGNGAFGN
jgi:hypothetical protein